MKLLSIRSQLLMLAATCLTLLLGLSVLVVQGSRTDAVALRDIYERGFQPMLALQEVDRQLKEVRFRLAGVLLEQIPVTGSRNHLKEVRETAPTAWKRYVATSHVAESARQELVSQIDTGWEKFSAFAGELELAYVNNDRKRLATLLEDDWPGVHIALVKPLEQLLPQAIKEAEVVYVERSSAMSRRQLTAIAGLMIGGLVLAVFLMWFYRRLRGAFAQIVAAMRQLAAGDLGTSLDCRASAETVVIGREFGNALDQVNGLVARIRGIASQMQAASVEIARGHEDLLTRTAQQAASLEETAASMEEMTATVSQNAENARKATKLSEDAAKVAVQGGKAVNAVVDTMTGISESSKKISEIIGVIDSIAFQTNILALNAAVEAARAGEQGRGFAVVASEVRRLAHRSADAAKEIRELIMDSVTRVDAGSMQVSNAGKTMGTIVDSVQRVNRLIAEISAASQEQAQGLSQVSDALQQLETVTQQNAAMVEKASAATMEDQAAVLMRAVGGFKLAEGAQQGNAASNAQPPTGTKNVSFTQAIARRPLRPALSDAGTRQRRAKAVPNTEPEGEWKEF